MRSKSNRNVSTEAEAVRAGTTEGPDGSSAHEEIRGRAYEIFLERGGQPGFEMDDWLQAERERKGGVLSRAQAV
jgi:hypothetical protein